MTQNVMYGEVVVENRRMISKEQRRTNKEGG